MQPQQSGTLEFMGIKPMFTLTGKHWSCFARAQGEDLNSVKLTLNLNQCDHVCADASIISWQPLHLQVRAWNARLGWYETLMENKLQRADFEAFTAIANEYMALVDTMTSEAVLELLGQRQFVQKLLSESLAVIFVGSMLLYLWLPWLGVVTDAVCISIMLAWCYLLEKQKQKLTDFMKTHEGNANERRRQFRENYLANFETRETA